MSLLKLNTPIFYQLALTRAMEALCGLSPEPHLELRRALSLSYARAYHHAQVISNILLCLELDNFNDLASTATSMMKPYADILARVHTNSPKQLKAGCI